MMYLLTKEYSDSNSTICGITENSVIAGAWEEGLSHRVYEIGNFDVLKGEGWKSRDEWKSRVERKAVTG